MHDWRMSLACAVWYQEQFQDLQELLVTWIPF